MIFYYETLFTVDMMMRVTYELSNNRRKTTQFCATVVFYWNGKHKKNIMKSCSKYSNLTNIMSKWIKQNGSHQHFVGAIRTKSHVQEYTEFTWKHCVTLRSIRTISRQINWISRFSLIQQWLKLYKLVKSIW